jgi:hypothetical protein
MVKEKPTVVADEDLPMDWVPLPVEGGGDSDDDGDGDVDR